MGVIEAPLMSHHARRSQRRLVVKERTFDRVSKLERENAKLTRNLKHAVMELQAWQKRWTASDNASTRCTVEKAVFMQQRNDIVEMYGFIEKGVYSNQMGVFVNK